MKTLAMYKIPRFNSFNEESKKEKETKDGDWHQHITLPLSPQMAKALERQRAAYNKVNNDDGEFNPTPGTEHKLSALADLIRAMDLDGKDVIDYILANDLVKGVSSDEP